MTAHSQQSTTLSDRSDGVTCTTINDSMIVYGGGVSEKVWVLHLEELRWEAVVCTGNVPAARKHHSAVGYMGEMYVFGGVTQGGVDNSLHALSTSGRHGYKWDSVDCIGQVPAPRSHHSAVIVGDDMYVYGGCQGQDPTVGSIRRLAVQNFYDVYRFNVTSCTWDLFCHREVVQPCLWGHSVAVFRHFLLHFGGFNLGDYASVVATADMEATIADVQPPTASLNDVVFILNLHTKEWTRSSPKGVAPAPRALHTGFVYGSEMVVFGGVGFNSQNQATPITDSWKWDIATGKWHRIEFCLTTWKSAKLMHALHSSILYVTQQLNTVFTLDLRMGGDWQEVPCDTAGLTSRYQPPPKPVLLEPPPEPPTAPQGRYPVFMGDPRMMSPRRREEVDFEVAQRAVVKDEIKARLREEMLDEKGLAKETQIEALQKQIADLKTQLEVVSQAVQKPQQLPPAPAPTPTFAPAPPAPGPPPPPPTDPTLTHQVTRLVDAVSHLKTLSQPPPPQPPPPVATPMYSPAPLPSFTHAGPLSPSRPATQCPATQYPPAAYNSIQLTPTRAVMQQQQQQQRQQQQPVMHPPVPASTPGSQALMRSEHLKSLQRHLNEIEMNASRGYG